MKKLFFILISTLTLGSCYAQSEELMGKWIWVRTLYNDGSRLGINDKSYSLNLNYIIGENSLSVNGQKFEATFTKDNIQTQNNNKNKDYIINRTINYILKEGYLIETEENSNKTSYFLKVEDLIKKFPEFALKEINRNGEVIYIDNSLTGYEFNNKSSFEGFISRNMRISNGYKSFQDLNFKIEFILTKNNKITNIKVLQSTNKDFENQYLNALNTSEKYFKNTSGKDLLIIKEVDLLKWPKKIYQINRRGIQLYGKKDFKRAIKNFEKVRAFSLQNEIFKEKSKESLIRLGISYLAVGKTKEACRTFEGIGDITDFDIRNYLLDFCSK